jgi:gliding motility-associated-like protein
MPVVVTVYTGTRGRITLSGPTTACIGSTNTLTASTGTAYQWYRNDTLITGATSATYSAATTGAYSVSINDGNCSLRSADTAKLIFRDCSTLPDRNVFVPTAFTPNRNGQNDVLRPLLNSITVLNYFRIYNRWGQVVFETKVMGAGWDGTLKGTPQPSETYSWILECVGLNGQIIKRSGRTLLIR